MQFWLKKFQRKIFLQFCIWFSYHLPPFPKQVFLLQSKAKRKKRDNKKEPDFPEHLNPSNPKKLPFEPSQSRHPNIETHIYILLFRSEVLAKVFISPDDYSEMAKYACTTSSGNTRIPAGLRVPSREMEASNLCANPFLSLQIFQQNSEGKHLAVCSNIRYFKMVL